jgi:hypothetical protein
MVSFAKDSVTNRSHAPYVCVYDGAIVLLLALNQSLPALSRAAITPEENPQVRPATRINCLSHSTRNYHPLETQPQKCKVSIVYWSSTTAFTEPCNGPKRKSSSPKTPRSRSIPSILWSLGPV